MNLFSLKYLVFLVLVFSLACQETTPDTKIAFLADVHLHDVYAELEGTDYRGVWNPKSKKYATIRTMESQLHSTRLFNENYFAFLAALDDIAARGIKYVVMPGDFSDDGQPMNILALQRILEEYSSRYGIKFLLATGNHDPVRPFNLPAGKADFLGEEGRRQPIMSEEGIYAPTSEDEWPVVLSPSVEKSGYQDILAMLSGFGFYPKEEDLYWETPFSEYSYESYDYSEALSQSELVERSYAIAEPHFVIPDVSYLCEPTEGLWFLSIDANVYIPTDSLGDPTSPKNYGGAGTGYNHVMSHKKHLIDWISKVASEAKRLNKTLIPFSHYPMVEFYDDAAGDVEALFGEHGMQLYRVPREEVAQIFSEAGLKLHFGGHMHINDTGTRKFGSENTLVNVQIPSLAAYIPGYKIATILPDDIMEIETVQLEEVPRFDELFDLYRMEHDYLTAQGKSAWNLEVLESKSYIEYTEWHLKQLIALRFLKEWPEELKELLHQVTGLDMLYASQEEEVDVALRSQAYSHESIERARALLEEQAWTEEDLDAWTGYDLILDFYRLRSADELAFAHIGSQRLAQYEFLYDQMGMDKESEIGIQRLLKIMHHFSHGQPSDHFVIDLNAGTASRK